MFACTRAPALLLSISILPVLLCLIRLHCAWLFPRRAAPAQSELEHPDMKDQEASSRENAHSHALRWLLDLTGQVLCTTLIWVFSLLRQSDLLWLSLLRIISHSHFLLFRLGQAKRVSMLDHLIQFQSYHCPHCPYLLYHDPLPPSHLFDPQLPSQNQFRCHRQNCRRFMGWIRTRSGPFPIVSDLTSYCTNGILQLTRLSSLPEDIDLCHYTNPKTTFTPRRQ